MLKKRLLLVDDAEEIVLLVKTRFEAMGYDVSAAGSGEECLEIVENAKPDLILLDIMLPNLNGFEVCRELKKNPALKNIPVVMISAKSGEEDLRQARDVGAIDYFVKPFQLDEVEKKIRKMLES